MKLFYSDNYRLPTARGSTFPVSKYHKLRERIERELDADPTCQFELHEASPVSLATLRRAHTASYVERVIDGTLDPEEQRRIGFPWSPELVARSLRSVGGTVGACFAALRDGVAANLAGGTHHARSDRGAGYCVFNDVAVATKLLVDSRRVERVMVIDADVHQGDGSAEILAASDRVFTFSIHCADNFPSRKATSDLDIALAAGTADHDYLREFRDGVKRASLASRPDFVLYLAGADPYVDDRLGRLNVSKAALAERDQVVFDHCRRAFLPVAIVMGGGYARQVDDIVAIHFETLRRASSLDHFHRAGAAGA